MRLIFLIFFCGLFPFDLRVDVKSDTIYVGSMVEIKVSVENNKNKVIKEFCKKNKIDFISIDTAEGYLNPLEQFFSTRMHRH